VSKGGQPRSAIYLVLRPPEGSRGCKGRLLVADRTSEIYVSASLFPLDGINGAKPSVYMWG
jgi:hypothetical protein